MKEEKIIYKDLSYEIVGICFKAHKLLGRFCREKQYCDVVEDLLIKQNIIYEREKVLDIFLGETKLGGNRVDFLIEHKILFDAKAKPYITKEDYMQMQRYLVATNMKLGIIVNFREPSLFPKRVINSQGKEF